MPSDEDSGLTCHACGYSLRGLCSLEHPRGECPECGAAYNYEEAMQRADQGPPPPAWAWKRAWLIVMVGPFVTLGLTLLLAFGLELAIDGWNPWSEHVTYIPLLLQCAATVYASFCIMLSDTRKTRFSSLTERALMAVLLVPILLCFEVALAFFVTFVVLWAVMAAAEALG